MHGRKARRHRAPKSTSCVGKIPHLDKLAAQAAAQNLIAAGGVNIQYYQCKYCDGWHIGHERKRR